MSIAGKKWSILLTLTVITLAVGPAAYAQLSEEELRRERIETIEQLKSTEEIFGTSSRAGAGMFDKYGMIMDYGGAASISYTGGSNNDRNQGHDAGSLDSTDHNYDYELNLFSALTDQARMNKLYVRLKTKYTETKRSGTAGSVRGNDYEQLNFDMAYFEKKIATKFFSHTWTFGRQYISVGRGIAYGQVADGIDMNVRAPKGLIESYEMFAVRQLPRDDNSDVFGASSIPAAGHTHRQFLGMELKIRFAPRHKMTFFYVLNDDKNNDSHPIAGRHQFDCTFLGYGLSGSLPFSPNLSYFGEYITERGKNFGRHANDMQTPRDAVRAFAFDVGMKYAFPKNKYTPSVYTQYSVASGDPDRVGTPTGSSSSSALGAGNIIGTDDHSFQPFGGLSLGFALAPSFSNIRATQLGGSIKPWKDTKIFNNATLSLVYYNYRKDVSTSPMSDPFAPADPTMENLGSEWNTSVKWKILSDFKSDFRLGYFRPGEAYGATRTAETYIKYKFTVDL